MKKLIYMLLTIVIVWVACEKTNDDLILQEEYGPIYTTGQETSDEAITQMAEFFIQVAQNRLFESQMKSISNDATTSKMAISVFEAIEQIPSADLYQVKNSKVGSARGTFDWQKYVESHPTVDIEIPDFADFRKKDWSFDKVEKIVVVDSKTKGREDVDFYDVYDVETGKKEKLSAEVPPGKWVMILKESDHKIAVNRASGKTLMGNPFEPDPEKFLYSSGIYDVYTIVDVFLEYSEEGNGIPDDNNSNARACLRDRYSPDYICKIRAVNYYGLNQWAETNVVIRADYGWLEFYPPSTWYQGKSNKVWYAQKIDFGHNGSVWDHYLNPNGLGTTIFEWDNSRIGDKMTYSWMEIDEPDYQIVQTYTIPPSTVKYKDSQGVEQTVTSSSSTVSYTTTPKNDPLGAAEVTYCDHSSWPGYQYNTGSLLFWVGD